MSFRRVFGRVRDREGGCLVVQESGPVDGTPHVWLVHEQPGGADPLLSLDQADALANALRAFVDAHRGGPYRRRNGLR